ncbi:MAG: molybdopterin-dependent oxidoreductase [Eggerthellaceae bacterium]|nr:molybdopterin-dependent oxidoreductase [Eggerthellaceae bacterium]
MSNSEKHAVSRRNFVKGSFAGTVATAGLLGSAGMFGCSSGSSSSAASASAAAPIDGTEIHWSQCNVNCGGNCVFQWHSKDGKVLYMETDNTGDADFQARACLRGRSMRRWLNHPDRLMHPMKRVGERGSGQFEEISWDEALDLLHDKLQETIDKWGNEAIYNIYATGMYSTTGRIQKRFLNTIGGCMDQKYDYSTHMLQAIMPYMYGFDGEKGNVFSPYDNVNASSFSEAEANSDLIVMFGNSPAETRMGGANATWDYARAREAVLGRGGKVINIDYRMNETCAQFPEEWLPIRPGTDAALAAALVHEFIADKATDEDFLAAYTVGWNEDTMPESAKGKNLSYYDYIMGTGYDMVEKTPEWAAEITMIPADKIRELAKDLESAKAPFVVQGWGPQRHTNGEETTRAICMVPIALGQIGLPGTNTGQRETEPPTYLVGSIPGNDADADGNVPEGGVKPGCAITLPVYQYLNAVDHGHEMSVTNAGISDPAGELDDNNGTLHSDIHFIWSYAGNCITNQHGDINKVHEVLTSKPDDELFILVWDTVMTDSAKYADLLLPDAMRSEQINMQTQGYSEYYTGVTVGTAAQTPPGDCRSVYDVLSDLADKFGTKDQFTQGRTQEEWAQALYEAGASADGQMPTWDAIQTQGVYKRQCEPSVGLKAFRDDPEANPLGTPSGKIEIYSETLAKLNDEWQFENDERIHPIPDFHGGFQGYGSVNDEYPLYGTGFHHKSRTHSSFGFIEELEQVARQQAWINPADAEPRGIANGDQIRVKSPAGEIQIEAKVTNRIVPGTVAIPQGSWHKADMSGDKLDTGGCVNTLTTYHPSPYAKGNGPAHSFIAQVTKA